ncbi:Protein FAM43A [Armadillidium vulgare]|nr:Protein FAM43A [Armadillidium vulgare]
MPNINLKKLWRRKKSVDITEYDPTYKVTYLGNVLTGWAKGDGCVEKPLATLWRNYCQSSRPDISMKVTICGAGLRAVTREHGLTEYWAHRITYCAAHPAYPRVFCWVYRHEGRRLKQELRCHAVLCPKQGKAERMASQLQDRLSLALHEFRREKAIRQNARLSVVNAVYDVSTLPLRKFYLVTGASNYRPPLERSKSAPRLGAIEEIIEEEEDELEEVCEVEERLNEESQKTVVTLSSPAISSTSSQPSTTPSTPSPPQPTHFDELLKMLRQPSDISTTRDVALVYQQVDDTPIEVSIPQEGIVTFSSPNLMYYSRSQPPEPPDEPELETTPFESPVLQNHSLQGDRGEEDDDDDLGLLESFKDKMGISNGEESLTSDQPESIGSHSCSSSSCDGGGGGVLQEEEDTEEHHHHRGNVNEEKRVNTNDSRGKILEEEDNISEESGYSEDKECIGIKV